MFCVVVVVVVVVVVFHLNNCVLRRLNTVFFQKSVFVVVYCLFVCLDLCSEDKPKGSDHFQRGPGKMHHFCFLTQFQFVSVCGHSLYLYMQPVLVWYISFYAL